MPATWEKTADRGNRERMVEYAKEDLIERVGVDPTMIVVESVTPVTWLDMTMGYPLPGRKVAPGYVPGYQIILAVGSQKYDYHSGFGRVVYVPAGKGQPPLPVDVL